MQPNPVLARAWSIAMDIATDGGGYHFLVTLNSGTQHFGVPESAPDDDLLVLDVDSPTVILPSAIVAIQVLEIT